MKYSTLTLVAILTIFINNTTMAQQLFNLNIPVWKSDEATAYLTSVERFDFHNFYTKEGKSDFIIHFKLRIENHNGRHMTISPYSAQFIPDSLNLYKIMETNLGNTHLYKEPVEQESIDGIPVDASWEEGIREFPPSSDTYFCGYSNDTTLVAVKALNYLNEHTTEPLIYNANQVDEQTVFMNGDQQESMEDFIWGRINKHTSNNLDGLSGFIRFGFVVNEFGLAGRTLVEQIELNNVDLAPELCALINYALIYYTHTNDQKHRWKPAKINGLPVNVWQSITIYFNK